MEMPGRVVLLGVLLFFAGLTPRGVLAAAQAGSLDWPMLQGHPAHTGAVTSREPAPPLARTWRLSLAGDPRVSGIVTAGGVGAALGPSKVVGFDPVTGERLWVADRSAGYLDPPALADSEDGTILVMSEGSGPVTAGIVGLNLEDRSRAWRLPLERAARGAPVVHDGVAYLGTREGALVAVDVTSGDERWRYEVGGRIDTSPAIGDGLVFGVSEDYGTGMARVAAVDVATGEERWTFERPAVSVRVSAPLFADGTVYIGFGDFFVRALDADSGELRWEQPVRSVFAPTTVPAFADGDLLIGDRFGSLYRLDGGTGERRWDFQFESGVLRGSPLVVDRYLYIGLQDGTLAAIELGTGDLVWRTTLPGAVGALTPAGDLLLVPVVGPTGGVFAFEHDPDADLVRVESRTRLKLLRAVGNFVLAAAVVLPGLFLLFGLLGRRSGESGTPLRLPFAGLLSGSRISPPRRSGRD